MSHVLKKLLNVIVEKKAVIPEFGSSFRVLCPETHRACCFIKVASNDTIS